MDIQNLTKEPGKLENLAKLIKIMPEPEEPDFVGENGLRTEYIYLVYDTSGSMKRNEEAMYDSFLSTCKALMAAENEDCDFAVKLVFFDETVRAFNEEFMPADQLAELVTSKRNTRKDKSNPFHCSGNTNISKIIDYLDGQFKRDSVLMYNLKSKDPLTLIVLVTDYNATDDEEDIKNSTEKIMQNRIYKKASRLLCIFCGEEENKSEAEKLAGSPENVVALGSDISGLLAPVTLRSTITLSDPTHIKGGKTQQTPRQIAQEVIKNEQEQALSANFLNEEETREKLINLLFNP